MEKKVVQLPVLPKMDRVKRVAAYARVSSGKDAMLYSLSQQVSYYSQLIDTNPGWKYAGVYADEALTGTKDDRPEFQRMLADCRKGKIDMVITKSISRFARNTVTLLNAVRELKSIGIDVFFEEENIHSLSSDGELMLTIFASYAQEESRSVSDNQKWRIRKGYANGELLNWHIMFGYRISKKDGIQINTEQAKVVKEIFRRIIRGDSLNSIILWLNHNNIQGVLGGKWNTKRLRALIENEKVTGNALMQKSYVVNHLTKECVKNNGELPKYYMEDSHPAIIDQKTFDEAQEALRLLSKEPGKSKWSRHDFSGMILCPHCKKNYNHVTTNHTSGWVCPTYYREGKAFCESKKIPDDALKETACRLMGWETYDNSAFHSLVDHIEAIGPNRLAFYFFDGQVEERSWLDRSRAQSWTPEMKAQAAERARRRYHE